MTTSKPQERTLCALQFATTDHYPSNLQFLLQAIQNCAKNAIIVAPEVCLTDFAYDDFDAATRFSHDALETILKHIHNQVLIFTMLVKREDGVYNVAKVIHQGRVIHEQAKTKLFKIGNEHHYFKAGSEDDVTLFECDGIKIGILICFELRFKHLWQKLEGADLICVTARWGKLRSDAFRLLTRSLSTMNQCYVLASDASNENCTSMSGIISPMESEKRNGNAPCLCMSYNQKEIKRIRRYLDVGI